MRHTYASMAINNGVDVYELATHLGHSKVSMTLDIYGHLWDEKTRGSLKQVGNVFAGAINGDDDDDWDDAAAKYV